MNKQIDNYMATERNEVLRYATPWINLENSMVSQRRPDTG